MVCVRVCVCPLRCGVWPWPRLAAPGARDAPYCGNDREDAKRFRKQFESAIDGENYNKGAWTGGDVLMGTHEGVSLNPSIGEKCALGVRYLPRARPLR